MSYLLDTNICSAHARRPGGVAHRFIQHAGRLSMPTIVLAELYAGAYMLDYLKIATMEGPEMSRELECD
jgi:predicted nucleic acid-binding protein